jgi:hypothetical protein
VLILALFANFEAATGRNGLKKRKTSVINVSENLMLQHIHRRLVTLNFFRKVKITALYYCTRLRKNLRNFWNATQEWRNV